MDRGRCTVRLCENCLDEVPRTEQPFPIGYDRGPQRDPYRVTIDLCAPCRSALGGAIMGEGSSAVDLEAFHARYIANREARR